MQLSFREDLIYENKKKLRESSIENSEEHLYSVMQSFGTVSVEISFLTALTWNIVMKTEF